MYRSELVNRSAMLPLQKKTRPALLCGILLLILQGCGPRDLTDEEYLQRAREATARGEMQSAVIEFKNALKTNPDNAQARLLLGQAYIELGDGASAEKELRQARSKGIAEETVLVPLANALFLQQEYDEVLKNYTLVDSLSPEQQAELLAVRGKSLLQAGNIAQARLELNKALELDSRSVAALLGQSQIDQAKGNLVATRDWVDQALKIQPDNPEALSQLGRVEEADGNLEAAEEAYTRAIDTAANKPKYIAQRAFLRIHREDIGGAEQDIEKLSDKYPGKHFAQGLVLFQRKQYRDAQTAFEQALNGYGAYAPLQYYLGLTHLLLGNEQQADTYLKNVLNLVPESGKAANVLAGMQLRKGDLEKAQPLLESVLGRDPDNRQALELMAGLEMMQGKPDQAVEKLERLVALDPDSADLRSKLGLALMAQGEVDPATAELEKAIALEPGADEHELRLVMGQLQAGENAKALESAERWVDKSPRSVPAHLSLGWAFLANRMGDQALWTFEKVLELSPGNPSASHNLAVFALQRGDIKQALDYYEESLKHHPGHPRISLALAKLQLLIGLDVKALPLLEQLWEQQPGDAEPAALLGKLLLRQGDAGRALKVIREAARTAPQDTAVLRVLGTAQAETGDYRGAVSTYQRLTAQQPESAPDHYLLAQAYYRNGDRKNFAAALEKAYQLDPTHFETEIAMVGLLMQRQQWEQARELVDKLKQDHPGNPEVHVQDAQLSTALNDPGKAVEAYRQALELAPDRNDLVVKYGLALWQAGQLEQAFKPMEDWLDKHPNDGVVRYNLANLYLLADRKSEAREAFSNILDSNPDHIIALNNLAWLLKDSEPEKAVAYAEQAYRLSPTPPVQDTLAMILLAQPGQEARAVRLLENAVRQAPGNAEIHFHLAQALVQSGDKQRATQVLTELLNSKAVFPGKPQAQKLLDELSG